MASGRTLPALLWLLALWLAVLAWSGEGDEAAPAQLSATMLGGNLDEFISSKACQGPTMLFFWSGLEDGNKAEAEAFKAFHASAEEVAGLACLGIIDCSKWRTKCEEQNIRQTPAVLLYPSAPRAARFFRGVHSQEGFTAAVARLISLDDRTVQLSMQNMVGFLEERVHPIKVLLFSRRQQTPVIFKALSSDAELWPHMHFGFVPEKESALLSHYDIKTVPQVVIQQQHGNDLGSAEFYDSTNITYPALREWLLEKRRNMWLGPVAPAAEEPEAVADESEEEEEAEEEEDEESGATVSGPRYHKLPAGTTGCPAGLEISSVQECQKAMAELGIKADPSWISNFPELPSRCSVRDAPTKESPERMHYNSFEGGMGRSDLSPVCKRPAAAKKQKAASATGTQQVSMTQVDVSQLPESLQKMAQQLGEQLGQQLGSVTLAQGGMQDIQDLLQKVAAGATEEAPAAKQAPEAKQAPAAKKQLAWEYMKLPYGTAGCPDGLEIQTPEECKHAIESLGMRADPSWAAAYEGLPVRCSVREDTDQSNTEHMHWNTALQGQGRPDLAPVCRQGLKGSSASSGGGASSSGSTRLPELSSRTQKELLGAENWYLVYLKEGTITEAEETMLLDLEDRFKQKLDEQGIPMRFLWLDLRAERALKTLLDPPTLPSAMVIKGGIGPKYALAQHQEDDDEPLPADEAAIVLLLNTVLGGDAKFVKIAAKKLSATWSVKRS